MRRLCSKTYRLHSLSRARLPTRFLCASQVFPVPWRVREQAIAKRCGQACQRKAGVKQFVQPEDVSGGERRMTHSWPGPPGNWLLAALSSADRELLKPHLHPVALPLGKRLIAPGEPIEFVYFLEAGLGSDIAVVGEGERPV